MDPVPRVTGLCAQPGLGPGRQKPGVQRRARNPLRHPMGSAFSRVDSQGAASPCNGNFLVSQADTPNYYLERLGEAWLIDYIFPSLTGYLFGCVVLSLPVLS